MTDRLQAHKGETVQKQAKQPETKTQQGVYPVVNIHNEPGWKEELVQRGILPPVLCDWLALRRTTTHCGVEYRLVDTLCPCCGSPGETHAVMCPIAPQQAQAEFKGILHGYNSGRTPSATENTANTPKTSRNSTSRWPIF